MTTTLVRRTSMALLLAAAVTPAGAGNARDGWPLWDIGFLVGAGLGDGDLAGGPYGVGEIGPVVGVRGARLVGTRVNLFADAVTARYDTDLAPGRAERVAARTGIEVFLGKRDRGSWFLSGAAGYAKVDFRSDTLDVGRPLGSLGVGQRIWLQNGTLFRWELRGEHLVGNEGVGGATVDNAELLVGWLIGSRRSREPAAGRPAEPRAPSATPPAERPKAPPAPPKRRGPDADGDGVPDRMDRCSFTPTGYPVDEHGCAKDTDGDGVPDGADRCANTPSKAWIDARGCPTDFDRDGVVDGVDRCPDTPAGVRVDEQGCPRPE